MIFFYQDWIIYRERDFSLPVCVCVIYAWDKKGHGKWEREI